MSTTAIAVSNAEIGKTIIQAATAERQKRFNARIVQIADSEMESVAVCKRKLDYYQLQLTKAEKRLAAIDAGEFTISDSGTFQYNDEALRMPTAEDPVETILARTEKAARDFLRS